MMKKISKFLFHMIIEVLTGWFYIVKGLVSSYLIKSIFMILASMAIIMYFICPENFIILKIILPAVYIIFCTLSAVRLSFCEQTTCDSSSQQPENDLNDTMITFSAVFDGMDKETATKEYRKLLKIYHPDNPVTGNENAARIIIEKYQAMFG